MSDDMQNKQGKDIKADALPESSPSPSSGPSRRTFLKGFSAAAGGAFFLGHTIDVSAQETQEMPKKPYKSFGRGVQKVTLKVDGKPQTVEIEPRTTLLDAIRHHLGETGPKEVCGRGSCGCCGVLLDGVAINSCMMLAMDAVGREITTVTGIAADPQYAPLIDNFCSHDAAQCGFCIPGFVVRSAEFTKANPGATPEQVREGLAGNICRCGTYVKIFEAVEATAKGGRS